MTSAATIPMHGLRDAGRLLKWVAMGVQPSQANAEAARAVLHDVARGDHGDALDLKDAARLLGYCAIGVIPSQERTRAALAQVEQAIEAQDELNTSSLSERYMRQRG